jgi:hypothetical protein
VDILTDMLAATQANGPMHRQHPEEANAETK